MLIKIYISLVFMISAITKLKNIYATQFQTAYLLLSLLKNLKIVFKIVKFFFSLRNELTIKTPLLNIHFDSAIL